MNKGNSIKPVLQLESMIDEIEDYAILFLDVDGNIMTWNKGAEKVKGYKSREIIGCNFRLFYTSSDREVHLPERLIQTAIKEGKAADEGWRVKKNGDLFWGSVSITAIHDQHGHLLGFTKVTRDLTEKMRAESALREYSAQLSTKNKELEQFVYIASHDLQEPLQTVISFIDLLKTEYESVLDEEGRMYMDFITGASQRMRSLIKSLLDYSRIGQNKCLEDINLNDLVSSLLMDLHSVIKEKNADTSVSELPVVKGYKTDITQLLMNLLKNGIKFSRQGVPPKIEISACRLESQWKIMVSDNGIGIKAEHREKIFLIFQRLHNRNEYEGNGIGLAHCRKIAEVHKGQLDFDSVPGKGSTFWFTIPDVLN
ncbi:sensor histidine kinase [Desertivirga xinjiangensis]|uniref:sensor histidine kinase n=1 Tax=Desertivirga xinjiangensis TaxID=539206 RepID=UPI00210CAA80|nr:ATP-binding protein [Pedobacter xinjiangensis]